MRSSITDATINSIALYTIDPPPLRVHTLPPFFGLEGTQSIPMMTGAESQGKPSRAVDYTVSGTRTNTRAGIENKAKAFLACCRPYTHLQT
jgi:hypothetical protein